MTAKTPATKAKASLSVVITAHAEGILLHKTLASVRRSLAPLLSRGVDTEIIIHVDNPNQATSDYLKANKDHLKDTRQFSNSFGDLGSSRNFAVKQAKGTYVTFIDADDLVSEHWFEKAFDFLEKHELGTHIAHTESTIEFGGANGLVIKHGEINKATDTLLSVFANRWNSIIMAPRMLLLEEPYTANSPGYGYEDWHLNSRFINRGVHNVLIPETAIFVRRKESESEWLRQKLSRSVLRATPLFNFASIRSIPIDDITNSSPDAAHVVIPASTTKQAQAKAAPFLKKIPGAERTARKLYHMARTAKQHRVTPGGAQSPIPKWLINEWHTMHSIERQVFLSDDLLQGVPVYDSLTPEHYQTAIAFKSIINHTTHEHYDYILFVPWLTKGGADKITIHYANTIQKLYPNKHIMVVATLPHESSWSSRLADGIDFIPFGSIAGHLSQDIQFRLLEQLIENSGAQTLHILNSELGYDFAVSHRHYLTSTNKKLIATSFSQSTDDSRRVFGYSHTHVPKVYEFASLITTDNQAVIDMWVKEYGFDPAKLLVHYQPLDLPDITIPERPISHAALRVLWAARVSPEKQPALVGKIGELVKEHGITIDMYGHPDAGFDTGFLQQFPDNVRYKGSYDNFFALPLDQYDAYLYTSLFDGMPNTILEAAGAQLAIVSSAVGGVPTFITDSKSGSIVTKLEDAAQYADALIKLRENPELIPTYGKALSKTLHSRHTQSAYDVQIKDFLAKLDY